MKCLLAGAFKNLENLYAALQNKLKMHLVPEVEEITGLFSITKDLTIQLQLKWKAEEGFDTYVEIEAGR